MILGISDSHDASAALLTPDGTLSALQEERPTRIKNFHDTPGQAIAWLLKRHGIAAADVPVVALANFVHFRPVDRAQRLRNFRASGTWKGRLRDVARRTPLAAIYQANGERQRTARYVELGFRTEAIKRFDHHLCHAATAYHGAGRYDRPILIVTCDGAGDGLCATVSIGRDGAMERLHTVEWSHSFAMLYAVVTYMMGMVPNEHEYKLMGMAPYAAAGPCRRIADKLHGLFVWDSEGRPIWRRRTGVPHTMLIQPTLQKLFFEERFDAIMGGLQLFTEEMLCELIRRAVRSTGIQDVALAGGVFMNVKANKAIMALDDVASLYIYPSCGDETTSIGAAYLAHAELHGGTNVPPLRSFYLGPEWSDREIETALAPLAGSNEITVERPGEINAAVVDCLTAGEVVGRFAGREEFGARSLGNRAILADPRQPGVVRTINEMVKSRDFWMPFASSVMAESADEYLVNPKKIPAPHMILSFDTTKAGAELLAAGIHPYDETCRPQVVERETNPEYWDLIARFKAKSGVGGVLNTSLNLHGLPLVHQPEDALHVMRNSGLKRLALGPYLVTKAAA